MWTSTKIEFRLAEGALPPSRQHVTDAGWDLHALHACNVWPGTKGIIRTGVSIALPRGHVADVRSRSGLARKHNIFVINSPGTVDAGYRGEVVVMLFNLGGQAYRVEPGDRVAQLVVHKLPVIRMVQVAKLPDGERGDAGFGSTGR